MASIFGQQPRGLDALLQRPRPSIWQQFQRDPYVFLARLLYERSLRYIIPAQPLSDAVSVVCVSDTHNSQPDLPHGDILIHAGDLTQSGSLEEVQAAIDWLRSQTHQHKIVIAGNHDLVLDPALDAARWRNPSSSSNKSLDDKDNNDNDNIHAMQRARLDWRGVTYLQDTTVEVQCSNGRRLRVYGSPKSCRHGNWAFQYPRTEGAGQWSNVVPDETDILVTHGPPRAHLDTLRLGCPDLLGELWRVRPVLHVFGHVHEGYGKESVNFDAVQAAYERTVVAGGGLWNLLSLLTVFLQSMFLPLRESQCLLVNPSAVGGLRDDQKRAPVKVFI